MARPPRGAVRQQVGAVRDVYGTELGRGFWFPSECDKTVLWKQQDSRNLKPPPRVKQLMRWNGNLECFLKKSNRLYICSVIWCNASLTDSNQMLFDIWLFFILPSGIIILSTMISRVSLKSPWGVLTVIRYVYIQWICPNRRGAACTSARADSRQWLSWCWVFVFNTVCFLFYFRLSSWTVCVISYWK